MDVHCMKYSLLKRLSERMEASACGDVSKPQTREPCHGDCLLKNWQYSAWSQVQWMMDTVRGNTVGLIFQAYINVLLKIYDLQCSKSCGRGTRSRESYCMNNLGRRLVDRECNEYQRVLTDTCNEQPCPKWTVSEWSEVGLILLFGKMSFLNIYGFVRV